MGTGIGIVASRVAGLKVDFVDPSADSLKKSEKFIQKWCLKEIEKGRMQQADLDSVMGNISFAQELKSLNHADFVVEAASEDFELKRRIFTELAKTTPDHAILASNTSSISISKIAGVIPARAHQVIGMHFMNPVPVMQLVEVIRGLQTTDETHKLTLTLAD